MMLKRLLLLIVLLFPASALAQFAEDGIEREGRRGRFSEEQIRAVALRHLPGEILETDIEEEDSERYYEYTIRMQDGSIYELEINARTGEIYELEVEHLSEKPLLPRGRIDEEIARDIARSHVQDKTGGALKARIKRSVTGLHMRNLAYIVTVEKSARRYEVFVDAFSGKILAMEEVD